jgi:hypothetical protein
LSVSRARNFQDRNDLRGRATGTGGQVEPQGARWRLPCCVFLHLLVLKLMREDTKLVLAKSTEATLETRLQEQRPKFDPRGVRWRLPFCIFLHLLVLQTNERRYNASIGETHRSDFRDRATKTGGQFRQSKVDKEMPEESQVLLTRSGASQTAIYQSPNKEPQRTAHQFLILRSSGREEREPEPLLIGFPVCPGGLRKEPVTFKSFHRDETVMHMLGSIGAHDFFTRDEFQHLSEMTRRHAKVSWSNQPCQSRELGPQSSSTYRQRPQIPISHPQTTATRTRFFVKRFCPDGRVVSTWRAPPGPGDSL